jgi:hypothetical protein
LNMDSLVFVFRVSFQVIKKGVGIHRKVIILFMAGAAGRDQLKVSISFSIISMVG